MYAYTMIDSHHIDKNFDFLECLLFGALISATDPGMLVWIIQTGYSRQYQPYEQGEIFTCITVYHWISDSKFHFYFIF